MGRKSHTWAPLTDLEIVGVYMMKNVYASLQESPEPGVYFFKDGILRHQFNKRLEPFVPCYS
jgi:hypothetical protein